MITYVNTVLVGTGNGEIVSAAPTATALNTPSADAGKYVVMTMDQDVEDPYATSNLATAERIKIGIVTSKNTMSVDKSGKPTYHPIIKWSNIIKKEDIKSFHFSKYFKSSEDTVKIDLTNTDSALLAEFAKGYKRIVVRLTFKDLPTRYRKWTESYEYVTKIGDDATSIAEAIAAQINIQYKRARVSAEADAGVITLVALPYTDDDAVDTINWANKVRFSANIYWTDPTAPAFASKNKYVIQGASITKVPGKWCQTDAKLVRDREAKAMGYEGILNRGQGTWPIIKPDMVTNLSEKYDGLTLEFENKYYTADDLVRKTKQTLEIYDYTSKLESLVTALTNFAGAPVKNGIEEEAGD